MAAFRKLSALAILALVFGLVTASAQTAAFQCTANAGVPPLLRSEGLTELTGDIVLNCTGGTPTATGVQIPTANISIFLNTAVTSRLLSTTGLSEAALLIDEPAPASQLLCSSSPTCYVTGLGGGSGTFNGTTGRPNIWQGTVSGNSVTFIGIPVEPPGSVGARIYRITNVRANASAVAPGGFGTPGQVVALISATPATGPSGTTSSFPINNPSQIVGFVQAGLTFAVNAYGNSGSTSTPTIQQCVNFRLSSTVPRGLVSLAFGEGFATAFKPRYSPTVAPYAGTETSPSPSLGSQNVPGLIYNAESGFFGPATGTVAGYADFGTRLRATFSNIPAGISIYVTTTNQILTSGGIVIDPATVTGQPTSTYAARLVGTESGAFFPVPASATASLTTPAAGTVPFAPVTIINGTGTAVWEVLGADPLVTQTFYFGVLALATANQANNLPAVGVGRAAGSFAPAPPAFTAADGAKAQGTAFPVPRFVDTGSAKTILTVALCRTILLFPFVTNQAGFDTGLAISNTTQDPLGTTPQSGTCDLNFYGANAPSVITSPAIAGGSVYTNLASSAAPNFQGYVIAICSFQYAHGFAFVSDLGARNLAMGYLALVMPDGGRQNLTAGVSLANGSGEVLGQ